MCVCLTLHETQTELNAFPQKKNVLPKNYKSQHFPCGDFSVKYKEKNYLGSYIMHIVSQQHIFTTNLLFKWTTAMVSTFSDLSFPCFTVTVIAQIAVFRVVISCTLSGG
jgi:hypothetical protein